MCVEKLLMDSKKKSRAEARREEGNSARRREFRGVVGGAVFLFLGRGGSLVTSAGCLVFFGRRGLLGGPYHPDG